MTNKLAILIGLAVLCLIGLDIFAFDGANLLFLGKKLFWLIEWLAFWR